MSDDAPGTEGKKAEEQGAFDLAPEIPPAEPRPAKPAPAKIEAAGLTDDFDEDADFETDPAVEKMLGKKTAPKTAKPADAADPDAPAVPAFVKPGWGGVEPIGIAGLVTTAVSLLFALMFAAAGTTWYWTILQSLYHTALYTVAGVLAVVFGASLAERPLGKLELAGARMLLAVAAFQTFFNLKLALSGHYAETLLAVGAYITAVLLLFRFRKNDFLAVVGCHFVLVLLLMFGSWIEVHAVPVAAK